MSDPSVAPIDCTAARRMLLDYLDGELSPARTAAIRAHLEVCRHCFRIANLERTILEAIGAVRQRAPLPESVKVHIRAALEEAGLRRT